MYRVTKMGNDWFAVKVDLDREEDRGNVDALVDEGCGVILVEDIDIIFDIIPNIDKDDIKIV